MSLYLGDYDSGCSVAGTFTTVTTTGAPTVLTGTAGSVCLIAYKLLPSDVTGFVCSTAGITLATNCAGVTGWNAYGVNTNSDPTFYSCGHDFSLIVQGGTVGGTCVSGYTVALFSLDNRSPLRPIVHGRPADVDGSGRVLTQPCSTTFTVTSVLNDVNAAVRDKTGFALSVAGITCITSAPITEPANVPGWPMSVCTLLGWLGALATNCITQTASTQSVCNRSVNSTIASAPITCAATIVHRGTFGAVIP